ncbi:hypothetical protein [Marinobacter mangrovi]|uniref:hypothetical protein n=1 Tax=Marinobacter mangrovi TaxID=2803918 RepID=UPI0019337FC4|nr:hypothetical protein [Marinobacter mangrovi]
MSDETKAMCMSCQGPNQLSQEDLAQLGKSEPIACGECGAMVKIKPDPDGERKAMLSVLTLTAGALIVCVVALINLFGDAGFPTYFVAIPFILISTLLVSIQSANVIKLQPVD